MDEQAFLSSGLEAITERVVIAPLETAFLTLALPGFDQVLQTARSLRRGFPAFGATALALFA